MKFKVRAGLVLLFVLVFFVIPCLFGDRVAALFLFHPWKQSAEWEPSSEDCEYVRFPSADGSLLDGLYFRCDNPKAVILYSHGNEDNIKNCEFLGDLYRNEFDASILIYDYRGYGRSEGKPSASGILEDGRAALKWLSKREGIPETEIVQMGFSLGGSVAIDLASSFGSRGLIVQSTFSSLPDIARARIPFLPGKTILREQLDSRTKILRYENPLFLSHGTADRVIPYRQGVNLFESANEPKTMYTIDDGPHSPPNDKAYLDAIRKFIDSLE